MNALGKPFGKNCDHKNQKRKYRGQITALEQKKSQSTE